MRRFSLHLKRALDIVLATTLLLLLMPLMAAISAAVAMDGGPIIHGHRRVGRNGKEFSCLKFRTMIMDAENCLSEYLGHHPNEREEWERERKLAKDPRITSIGRMLRRSSLDELPQLWNVIEGNMSLVGPRPVTQSELGFYGESVNLYKSVQPGITGLWQISGRNNVAYNKRVMLDAQYVLDWTLKNDLNILLRTPRVVLSRAGAL